MYRLTEEQIMDAISEGVRRAIWGIATNATGMPCHDFYAHIKDGVREAMSGGAPDHDYWQHALHGFSDECLVSSIDESVDAQHVYNLWRWWCKREGLSCGCKAKFINSLIALRGTLTSGKWEVSLSGQALWNLKIAEQAKQGFLEGR